LASYIVVKSLFCLSIGVQA